MIPSYKQLVIFPYLSPPAKTPIHTYISDHFKTYGHKEIGTLQLVMEKL